MLPANQGLGTDDHSPGIHLRLIEEPQLVGGECLTEFGLHPYAHLKRLFHLGMEGATGVAAFLLGVGHRQTGALDQLVRGHVVVAEADAAQAVRRGMSETVEVVYAADEHIRPDTTVEALGGLRPYFKKDGLVTAGNASGIGDGGASAVLASAEWAEANGIQPLGRIVSWGFVGVEPKVMGIGPAPAARLALEKAGMSLEDMEDLDLNVTYAQGGQVPASALQTGAYRETADQDGHLAGHRGLGWLLPYIIVQLGLVALPEEWFFRGYLQARMDQHMGTPWRFLGTSFGPGLVIAAIAFAALHPILLPGVHRLLVFFPALLFGWLRARTGNIGAAVVVHAACNLLQALTAAMYG